MIASAYRDLHAVLQQAHALQTYCLQISIFSLLGDMKCGGCCVTIKWNNYVGLGTKHVDCCEEQLYCFLLF